MILRSFSTTGFDFTGWDDEKFDKISDLEASDIEVEIRVVSKLS